MDVVYERCCGLDVHKKTVVACLLRAGADGQRSREVRTFAAMTDDLLALAGSGFCRRRRRRRVRRGWAPPLGAEGGAEPSARRGGVGAFAGGSITR